MNEPSWKEIDEYVKYQTAIDERNEALRVLDRLVQIICSAKIHTCITERLEAVDEARDILIKHGVE